MTTTAPLRSPQPPYHDWERSHWAAQDVDWWTRCATCRFYVRFQNEVVADPATIAEHVTRAREALAEPFRIIFDDALEAPTPG